jgi:predicted phosphoribosyltransferase
MSAVPITPTIMAKLTHAKGDPFNCIEQPYVFGARSFLA